MSVKSLLLASLIALIGIACLGYFLIKLFIPWASITSWYRSPWHNTEVGGVPGSLHQIGMAWDIVPADTETYLAAKAAFFWGRVIKEVDHIHIQII